MLDGVENGAGRDADAAPVAIRQHDVLDEDEDEPSAMPSPPGLRHLRRRYAPDTLDVNDDGAGLDGGATFIALVVVTSFATTTCIAHDGLDAAGRHRRLRRLHDRDARRC